MTNLKCMYCAEMGITNTDVFIEIVDVELGHGWICKECFIESEKEKENFLKAELQSIKERNRTLEELEVFRVEELAKLDDLRVENTKLKKQLKAKEQECEELKRQHQGDKGLITSTGKMNYQLLQEYDKLKTALTEIKELLLKTPTDSPIHCVNAKSVILQKISECEGNDGL